VSFKDRKQAQQTLQKCQEQPLLLSGNLIPVRVAWAYNDVRAPASLHACLPACPPACPPAWTCPPAIGTGRWA
jgi:hypothetical protein